MSCLRPLWVPLPWYPYNLYQEKSWALYGRVRWPAAGGCWWSWPVAGLGRLSGSSFLYDRTMQGLVGN